MIHVDDTLLLYAEKYQKAFKKTLSLRMFPQALTNEELYTMIDDCISRNTNDLVEQFVNVNDNVLL